MYDSIFKVKVCFDYLNFTPSLRRVARKYNVSKSSVSRWLSNCSRTLKKKRKSHKQVLDHKLQTFYKDFVRCNNFFTLHKLQNAFNERFRKNLSISTISRHLKLCKISRKRTAFKHYVPERTHLYDYKKLQEALEEPTTISIDETCFYYSETPRYGYAEKGIKVVRKLNPYANAKRRSISLVVAITCKGILGFKLQDVGFKAETFNAFIQSLEAPKGSKLVMDNVAFHKTCLVLETCKNKGFDPIFIPPYSPEFNPIEYFFSSLKSQVRFDNKSLSNIDTTVRETLNNIRTKDYNSVFRHCVTQCHEKQQK